MAIDSENYLEADAIHSFGCQVFKGAYVIPTPDVLTEITQVKSISFNGETFTPVEVTHLFSPDKFKEFIPGFGDGGEITITFNWNPRVFGQVRGYQPLGEDMPAVHGRARLVLSSPSQDTITFWGFFNTPSFNAQTDAAIEMQVTFKVSGKSVFVYND